MPKQTFLADASIFHCHDFRELRASLHIPHCDHADLPGVRLADSLTSLDPDRAHLIQASVEAGHCWVAIDGKDVLGLILLSDFFGHGFIPLLVVAAANRRLGIATSLLNKAAQCCHRSKLFVSCNRSNLPAQKLFEKCGFEPSGRIMNLDEGDDEVFYFKRIDNLSEAPRM